MKTDLANAYLIYCPHECELNSYFNELSGENTNILHVHGQGKSVKVDDVREIAPFVSNKSFDGKANIAVIHNAQNLTAQAQNALLKILESPPGNSSIVLLSTTLLGILPTVISRCVKVNIAPAPKEVALKQIMQKADVGKTRAELLFALTNGYILASVELNENNVFFDIRENIFTIIQKMCNTNTYAISSYLDYFNSIKEQTLLALNIMQSIFADLLLVGSGNLPLHNIDMQDKMSMFECESRELLEIYDAAEFARNAILANANSRLGIEAMLIKILEVFNGKNNRSAV